MDDAADTVVLIWSHYQAMCQVLCGTDARITIGERRCRAPLDPRFARREMNWRQWNVTGAAVVRG